MIASCVLIAILAAGEMPGGQLAFVSGSGPRDRAVCVVDLATREVSRIGSGQSDGAPVWSPDGQWLAFSCARGAGRGIQVVRADGAERIEIPHAQDWNDDPAWSHDGRRVAYSGGTGLRQRIFVYDLDARTETPWNAEGVGLLRPVWLDPRALFALLAMQEDERQIVPEDIVESAAQDGAVFALAVGPSDNGISTDIAVATRAGWFSLPGWMLPSPGGEYAEWNVVPDAKGRRYAFESNDGGDREIFTVSRKGAVDVSNHRAADWNPVWSPDGKWIAFESFRGGRRGVYRVYRDSTRVYPVAASPGADAWSPAWSPDGKWIAYVSTREGRPGIAVAQVDGETVLTLDAHGPEDLAPAWRPVADQERAR